jgi:hypothetical protein
MESYFHDEFPRYDLWALVRLFKEREHRDQFVAGQIRLNTLGAYRHIEGLDRLRSDSWEGLTHAFPIGTRLTLAGHEITPFGPIRAHQAEVDGWNVCSFTALFWSGDDTIDESDLELLKESAQLPDSIRGFGEYVAVLTDAQGFIGRLATQLVGRESHVRHGLVHYHERDAVFGSVPRERVGFFKRSDFASQREFRIVVDRPNPAGDILMVDVSDLGQFALATTFDEFNAKADLRLLKDTDYTSLSTLLRSRSQSS